MRELHGYHGEHRRHARDARAPADNTAARAHDRPGHAARDAAMPRVLADPEARKAAYQAYRQKVEAVEAEYAARHARPKDDGGVHEQTRPRESKPEHADLESTDKPTSAIAKHRRPGDQQEEKQSGRERSWLPASDTAQAVSGVAMFASSVAAAFNFMPDKWDAVAVSGFGAAAAGVAWANRRWKERHGDRPEG